MGMTEEPAKAVPLPVGASVRPAEGSDWTAIQRLLTDAGLPLAGADRCFSRFRVVGPSDRVLACAVTEAYGDVALLRSVAVRAEARGLGIGERLCVSVLEEAAAAGARRAFLLTLSAGGFFPRFGFRPIGRDGFPPALAASPEMQGACPATALAMVADLRRPLPWIRRATPADAEAVNRIHAQGIEDRSATLDTATLTRTDREAWLRGRTERHPVIVAVLAGRVGGFASLNSFSPREAYRHVADLSIYVERDLRGHGLGTLLCGELIRRAGDLGYHKLVLTAFPFNRAGMALYARMGFRTVGVFHEQGQLDGRWVDTVVMERLL